MLWRREAQQKIQAIWKMGEEKRGRKGEKERSGDVPEAYLNFEAIKRVYLSINTEVEAGSPAREARGEGRGGRNKA